jgi:hypothetical protein
MLRGSRDCVDEFEPTDPACNSLGNELGDCRALPGDRLDIANAACISGVRRPLDAPAPLVDGGSVSGVAGVLAASSSARKASLAAGDGMSPDTRLSYASLKHQARDTVTAT